MIHNQLKGTVFKVNNHATCSKMVHKCTILLLMKRIARNFQRKVTKCRIQDKSRTELIPGQVPE